MHKDILLHNVIKTSLAQSAGAAVSAGFGAIMTAAGIPETVALAPVVRGATIGLINCCYDDFMHRVWSSRENQKIKDVVVTALQTFNEFAEKDGLSATSLLIPDEYVKYAYEVSENLMLTAIRQSEMTKIDILGRYYGRTFYKSITDWQDMHQMITMVGSLTLRQIVMIRLIAGGFKDTDEQLFISNPSACVEINRLKDYGIWKTQGAAFGIDESGKLQLCQLQATDYARMACETLMLDRLSDDDLKRTIDSLQLTADGVARAELTEDEFINSRISLENENGTLKFDGGSVRGDDDDKAMFEYDLARGK